MVLGKLDSHVEKNEMDHILHYTKKKKTKTGLLVKTVV